MKAQAVFLDRDGTIVRQIDGSYLSSINQIKLIETIYPVVASLQNEGYIIIIVTNQAGINKGIVTSEQVDKINQHIINSLKKYNIEITDVYVCPHKIEEHNNW